MLKNAPKVKAFPPSILNTLGVLKIPISGLEALKCRSGNPGALRGTNYYQNAQLTHLFVLGGGGGGEGFGPLICIC